MKYYTPEIWLGLNSDDVSIEENDRLWDESSRKYIEQLELLEPRLIVKQNHTKSRSQLKSRSCPVSIYIPSHSAKSAVSMCLTLKIHYFQVRMGLVTGDMPN
jgi:hypothetical protein